MSDTKQFVFAETIDDLQQQYSQRYQVTANDITETSTGPGGAWTASGTTLDGGDATRYDKELTNSSGNSETLTFPWGDAIESSVLTSKNGIPSSRCRVTFSNARIDNNGLVFYGSWTGGSSFPITYDFTITEEALGSDVLHTISINDQLPTGSGSRDWPNQAQIFNLRSDHVLQGSAVTGGSKNTLSSLQSTVRVGSYNTSGFFSGWDLVFVPEVRATATRSWEGNLYTIDGVNNDTVSFDPATSSLNCLGGIIQQAEASLACQSSLNEQSKNVRLAEANIQSETTADLSGNIKFSITKNLPLEANILASTENLVLASGSLTAVTSFSETSGFTHGIIESLTANTTADFVGNMIYDITGDYTWDSFNLNSYFVQGYAVADFSLNQGEYSWTFLANSTWDAWPTTTWIGDEATWDNWPDDVWETPYGVDSLGDLVATPTFLIGDTVAYTGTFTITEDTALEEAAEADLDAVFTTSFTASGVIDVDIAMSGAFAPALTANIIYDLEEEPIRITGAFTPVLTANAITDTFADIDVAFTFAVEPTFRPGTTAELYQAQSEVEINPTFRPSGIAALLAFASTLQVGRLFFQADPYFTIQVLQESRQVVLPFENRQTLVSQETRLNTIGTETGDYLVPQETRSLRLRIPPFKNRFSTPRVRQEQ